MFTQNLILLAKWKWNTCSEHGSNPIKKSRTVTIPRVTVLLNQICHLPSFFKIESETWSERRGERDRPNFRLHLLPLGVLVPLFGLHNILAAFKPDAEESKIRIAIEVYSALSIAFQV